MIFRFVGAATAVLGKMAVSELVVYLDI